MPDVSEPSAGRVLVLGGQGVLGSAIAGAFGAAGWTSIRAGRRPDSGADFRIVDLDEPDTLRGDYRSAAAGTVLFARSLVAGSGPAGRGPAGVLVPEEACTIGELRSALAESDIVVVDEQ